MIRRIKKTDALRASLKLARRSAPVGTPFCLWVESIQGCRASRSTPGYFISRFQREELFENVLGPSIERQPINCEQSR